jgi:putative component of membrane protein insertase Oxa1/YidC/SpoIIIJ protein YidD
MHYKIFLIIFIIMLNSHPVFSANAPKKAEEDHFADSTFLFPVNLFRKYISGADGDRCPMHPSCSGYAMEAFKKHGAFMGWIMTCDRLMRCGRDEVVHAPRARINGHVLSHDAVENNDFWWEKRK